MKALVLTNKPFLPTIDGGTVATKGFFDQLLSENIEIKHLTFSSEKHPFENELFDKKQYRQLKTENITIHLKPKPFDAIKAILLGKSYQLSRFESESLLQIFKEQITKIKFDLVILDSLYSAQMIEKFKNISPSSKFVLRSHNVESKLTREKSKKETNFLSAFYLYLLAKQLEKREKKIALQTNLILSISEDDTKIFQSWGIKKVITLPYFSEKTNYKWEDRQNTFMHFGAMNWQPNHDAFQLLVHNLFPKIVLACPQAKLIVAGSFMKKLPKNVNSSVQYLGFVENKFEFLSTNGILLVPIKNGSGVRIKIIEALSVGVPIITTEIGARGIPVKNGEGLVICKSDEEFIAKSIEYCLNKEMRMELSKNALTFYEKWRSDFSLKTIFTNNINGK